MSILIAPDELAALVASGAAVRILDVRWRLDDPDGGPPAYAAGHVPGAVFVDLHHELAEQGLPATAGRHPLPNVEALQRSARAWGIDDGDTVVVYDDSKNLASARAWWLLRYAGVGDVRVLDGALRGWVNAGLPIESGSVTARAGDVTLEYGALPMIDIDGAAAFPGDGSLLDARAGERFRGETEPIDPRAGHIPGAYSAPTTENVDADGRFLPAEALRERYAALGIDLNGPVAAYCGSGVTAAHTVLALAIAGVPAALYPGSWSQWSNHADRPVAIGAMP